jgi:hypothetical protein
VPGQFDHPAMEAAFEAIRETSPRQRHRPGPAGRNLALSSKWRNRGYRFLGTASEWSMMLEKGKEIVAALRLSRWCRRWESNKVTMRTT